MAVPLLTIAANGRNWITFEDYDTAQWRSAVKWLERDGYVKSGVSVFGPDEAVLPSYSKDGVSIASGFDSWSGNYLLAECEAGDQVLLAIANHVSALDRRSAA